MRKSISWTLVVAMMIATMGISVHQIYCYCMGETTVSFFEETPECSQTETQGSCCKADLPACCAKAVKSTVCAKEKDGGDCTKKTTRVFQLKVKFLVDYWGFKTLDDPALVEEAPICYLNVFRDEADYLPTFNKAPPPPPPSGREIGIRLQIFRC